MAEYDDLVLQATQGAGIVETGRQEQEPVWVPTPESSNVAAYMYDPATSELHVEFHSGGTYAYMNVPKAVAEEFAASGSKGRYVGIVLKRGYAFVKES